MLLCFAVFGEGESRALLCRLTCAPPVCPCLQLPWRTHLWAGAAEVVLVTVAACLGSQRLPTYQEALQLPLYTSVMYSVPLVVLRWQQHKEDAAAAAGAQIRPHAHEPAGVSGMKAGTSGKGSSGGSDCVSPLTVGDTRGNGTSDVASGTSYTAQQLKESPDPAAPLHTAPGKPCESAALPASAPDAPAATQKRGHTSLYSSPLEHGVVSLKVRLNQAC
jgi:hypothetical protein